MRAWLRRILDLMCGPAPLPPRRQNRCDRLLTRAQIEDAMIRAEAIHAARDGR